MLARPLVAAGCYRRDRTSSSWNKVRAGSTNTSTGWSDRRRPGARVMPQAIRLQSKRHGLPDQLLLQRAPRPGHVPSSEAPTRPLSLRSASRRPEPRWRPRLSGLPAMTSPRSCVARYATTARTIVQRMISPLIAAIASMARGHRHGKEVADMMYRELRSAGVRVLSSA
jgi:hypothetical protein